MPYRELNPSHVLPVLTEVADANTADIPVLTEIHTSTENPPEDTVLIEQDMPTQNSPDPSAKPLSVSEREQLAAQIAPQVEAMLQNAILDIQARLPELIRSALDKEHAARQND